MYVQCQPSRKPQCGCLHPLETTFTMQVTCSFCECTYLRCTTLNDWKGMAIGEVGGHLFFEHALFYNAFCLLDEILNLIYLQVTTGNWWQLAKAMDQSMYHIYHLLSMFSGNHQGNPNVAVSTLQRLLFTMQMTCTFCECTYLRCTTLNERKEMAIREVGGHLFLNMHYSLFQ